MSAESRPHLKRVVGTTMLTLYGIGNIVGAGVYVLIGKIAEPAGYLAVLAFLVAALVAFGAALSYAELAARFPVSAGIAVYLHEAFKARRLSTIVGLMLVGAGIVSSATLLKGFAGYFSQLTGIDPWVGIISAAVILTAVMLKGIKESVGVAALLTVVEVGGLLFLVGSILLTQPNAVTTFTSGFSEALGGFNAVGFAGIVSAAFIAFYAFVGFEDMVNIAEEVKKPRTAFPRAILISMAVVTILYVAVTVAALGVLTPQILANSSAPLADVFQAATGNGAEVIIIISLLATLNGVLVNIVMGSRFLYGMARRGWIPEWFSKVSRWHVPARGTIIVSTLALIAALLLPIERLAQVTSLLLLFVFLAANVSLIVVRRSQPGFDNLRISPAYMPWIGAVASVALLIGQLITMVL